MYNDYFFVRLMCGVNQTHRFIVCCSQRDFCNDLDAYSNEIRHALTATPMKSEILFYHIQVKYVDNRLFQRNIDNPVVFLRIS